MTSDRKMITDASVTIPEISYNGIVVVRLRQRQ